MKKRLTAFAVMATIVAFSTPSSAATVAIEISGTANSGSVGETTFGSVSYTLRGIGTLANIDVEERAVGDITRLPFDSIGIAIDGVGSYAITSPMRFFLNDAVNRAGVSRVPEDDETGADRFSFFPDAVFDSETVSFTENLTYTGSMALLQWNVTGTRRPVETEAGILTFGNRTDSAATLRIIAGDAGEPGNGAVVAPIPLPATVPMLVSALGVMGWLGRRRTSA